MAGELITQSGQWELNGLLMGEGTVYRILRGSTPHAFPDLRFSDLDRPSRPGLFAGDDLPGGRRVPLTIGIRSPSRAAARDALQDLQAAWGPGSVDVPLVWRDDLGTFRYVGRPRMADPDESKVAAGVVDVACRFLATFPYYLADGESSGNTGFPVGGSGFTFPVTFPLVFGAAGTGGVVNAANAGSVPVPWQASITGPWVNPTILHVASGRQLTINVTLATGEVLTVDSAAQSILLGGTASRFSSLVQPAAWFELEPGSNEVRFGGASGTGSATLTWRSGWM